MLKWRREWLVGASGSKGPTALDPDGPSGGVSISPKAIARGATGCDAALESSHGCLEQIERRIFAGARAEHRSARAAPRGGRVASHVTVVPHYEHAIPGQVRCSGHVQSASKDGGGEGASVSRCARHHSAGTRDDSERRRFRW